MVHVLFIADGTGARGAGSRAAEARAAAARSACSILGVEAPKFLDFPDNRMDTIALLDIVQGVEAEIAEFVPSIVYTHHAGDLNVDHRITHQAVLTACRPQPGHRVEAIYAFEVPSATDYAGAGGAFIPRRFVDIEATWPSKRAALEAYGEEMRPYPHTRSLGAVEALARTRGASVGFLMAEAFDVIRERISD
jgi:LmbE family N-acetylglucosaminyl deacetylase